MAKAAILVLADTDSHADLGRAVNAMIAAKEFKEAGDEVKLIFDGAGTKWPGVLGDDNHKAHKIYADVGDRRRRLWLLCGSIPRRPTSDRGGSEIASGVRGPPQHPKAC